MTVAQQNVINHIGSAKAIVDRCPKLVARQEVLIIALVLQEIRLDDEPFRSALARRIASETSELSDHSDDVVCTVGLLLYGPSGQNVEGLLTRR